MEARKALRAKMSVQHFETQDGPSGAAGWQPAGPLARRAFETQDGLSKAAGWQPAGPLRPNMGFQGLRVGRPQGH